MFSRWLRKLHQFIHQPSQVFFFATLVTSFLLLANGSLWRFWSLQQNQKEMVSRMMDVKEKSKHLEFEIREADKLEYIERQATDQFDYVREGDLIFIFSE